MICESLENQFGCFKIESIQFSKIFLKSTPPENPRSTPGETTRIITLKLLMQEKTKPQTFGKVSMPSSETF